MTQVHLVSRLKCVQLSLHSHRHLHDAAQIQQRDEFTLNFRSVRGFVGYLVTLQMNDVCCMGEDSEEVFVACRGIIPEFHVEIEKTHCRPRRDSNHVPP
jgi:hypothetical protein